MTGEPSGLAQSLEPDPASVLSVSDLARELQVLQTCAGHPSVRVLARRSGLASSTVQDALQGKRGQPSYNGFIGLVRALGMDTQEKLKPWHEAWVRVRQNRLGLYRPAPAVNPSVALPKGADSLLAQRPPVIASPGTGRRIAVMNQAQGAALISELELDDAVEQLADMSADEAARRLNRVRPARIAEVLVHMSESTAGAIVTAMQSAPVSAALDAMNPAAAGQILQASPPMPRAGTIGRLPPALVATIIQNMPGGADFFGNLGLPGDFVMKVLDAMPMNTVKQLLAGPFTVQAAALMCEGTRAGLTLPGRALAEVDAQQAAGWLRVMLNDADGARTVDAVDDARLAELLELAHRQKPRDSWLPLQTLQTLKEERLVPLMRHMDAQTRKQWISYLHGRISPRSINEIVRA